ncbi:MAG: EAL domain-containing protein, partial [Wenzhouxiangellaceae bacterium]
YANPSYLELFGYESFDELEGFSILDLLRSDDDATDLKHLLKSLARGDLPEEALALQAIRADGETFRASAEFAPAHYDGEPCTQIMIRKQIEAGDSAELQQELEKLRSHDLLTGLLNRQAFIRRLHAELEQPPPDRHMAVVLAALDNHGALQSRVGAAATDLLIGQSAEIFGEVIGDELLPARLSDHVLAARLWFGDRAEAEALATKVVETFSGRILEIRDKSPQVTASVGLALSGSQKFTADELLAQAETALREAERTGGNSYMRYRPPSTADDDNGEQWADKLRHALNNEEFRLVSLPITSMEDDEFLITEFETRLRLEGSDEVIMPSTFRPAAREAGLSVALDRDLIGHLLKWRQQNSDAGDMLIALSAECLGDDDFVQWLQKLVDDGELPGQSLILGVHQSEIGEQLRELQRLITRFAMRGVRFALLDVSIDARLDLLLKNINFN